MDVLTDIIVKCLPVIVASVGPALTAVVKSAVADIPKVLLPLLSAAIGTAAAVLVGFDYGDSVALGAAGSAIRELLDQTKKAVDSSGVPSA